ncbi:B(0,+)-type amino acid transporter [Pimephales promelas]|nr:B(0,+)-type amino acid transporter [Pimephales promelas]
MAWTESIKYCKMTILPNVKMFAFCSSQVPIVVPALVVIVSCYLVLAPIIDKPEWEYLYCTAFIVSGLLLYVPLIYYKFNWTRHIMRPLTMHLQLLLQVVPSEKIE